MLLNQLSTLYGRNKVIPTLAKSFQKLMLKISIPFSFFTAFINSSEPTKWFSIQEFHLRSVNFQKFLLSKMKFVQQDNYLHIVLAHTVELGKLFKKKNKQG